MTAVRATGFVSRLIDGRLDSLFLSARSCKKNMRSRFRHDSIWTSSTMPSRSSASESGMDLEIPRVTTSSALSTAG